MVKKIKFVANLIITILPIVLIVLPVNFFDSGQAVCLSKRLANMECYACGMTRATMHFIHFDFNNAWFYNKLSFIVVPMLVPLWLKAVFELQGKKLPGILGKLT